MVLESSGEAPGWSLLCPHRAFLCSSSGQGLPVPCGMGPSTLLRFWAIGH